MTHLLSTYYVLNTGEKEQGSQIVPALRGLTF